MVGSTPVDDGRSRLLGEKVLLDCAVGHGPVVVGRGRDVGEGRRRLEIALEVGFFVGVGRGQGSRFAVTKSPGFWVMLWYRDHGSRFEVSMSQGFRIQGLGFRCRRGSGFRVQGSGFRVQGFDVAGVVSG